MKIGTLKEVDIRELWKGEATDFTPWLAKEVMCPQILGHQVKINVNN